MTTNLPPLAAIRAFEAAARHASFTRAADELGMTQAAVSYQIKVLEDRVGSALFLRHPRGVELTETGVRLSRQAGEALDLLRDAFAEAQGRTSETLVLSVIATFATNFLAQRLGRFQIDNPSLALRVDLSQTLVDFAREDVDVAIRAGAGGWPDVETHLLLRGLFTPMLHPDLIEQAGGIDEPADLLKLPILEPSDPWWRTWFETAGVPASALKHLKQKPRLRFGSQVLEGNAAIAGQGVGILTPAFYSEAVAQGQLVQPFELTCDDGHAYWLVYPKSRRNAPKIRAFRDWILKEMEAFG